jgi:hypothetical protein
VRERGKREKNRFHAQYKQCGGKGSGAGGIPPKEAGASRKVTYSGGSTDIVLGYAHFSTIFRRVCSFFYYL